MGKNLSVYIERLRGLGTNQFPTVAQSVFNAKGYLGGIPLDPQAFGSSPLGPAITPAYEDVRGTVHKQLGDTFEGLADTGDAITKIADHYRELEDRMSS